jgi:hypothetical protein
VRPRHRRHGPQLVVSMNGTFRLCPSRYRPGLWGYPTGARRQVGGTLGSGSIDGGRRLARSPEAVVQAGRCVSTPILSGGELTPKRW